MYTVNVKVRAVVSRPPSDQDQSVLACGKPDVPKKSPLPPWPVPSTSDLALFRLSSASSTIHKCVDHVSQWPDFIPFHLRQISIDDRTSMESCSWPSTKASAKVFRDERILLTPRIVDPRGWIQKGYLFVDTGSTVHSLYSENILIENTSRSNPMIWRLISFTAGAFFVRPYCPSPLAKSERDR